MLDGFHVVSVEEEQARQDTAVSVLPALVDFGELACPKDLAQPQQQQQVDARPVSRNVWCSTHWHPPRYCRSICCPRKHNLFRAAP